MTIEQLDTSLHIAKARCATEGKHLFFTDALITQAVIDKVNQVAESHEHHHPTHHIQVMVYEKAPETTDIS